MSHYLFCVLYQTSPWNPTSSHLWLQAFDLNWKDRVATVHQSLLVKLVQTFLMLAWWHIVRASSGIWWVWLVAAGGIGTSGTQAFWMGPNKGLENSGDGNLYWALQMSRGTLIKIQNQCYAQKLGNIPHLSSANMSQSWTSAPTASLLRKTHSAWPPHLNLDL